MASGQQVKNGKAFEYAIAKTYTDFLAGAGIKVCLDDNNALKVAKSFFEQFRDEDKKRFCEAAYQTIGTLIKLEPGLTSQTDADKPLHVYLNDDSQGETGDVRDVIFKRQNPIWELGFSAKNNNDAVKHSRLSSILDFGNSWFGVPCYQSYWDDITPIFDYIGESMARFTTWAELGEEKSQKIYIPLLKAFQRELKRIDADNTDIPKKLIQYLVGKHPFYKIIKDDAHNMVVVKAFNLDGKLNKTVNGVKTAYRVPKINYPSRIVEFEINPESDNTLNMILDKGWEISFRIHNASSELEKSLKFDIRLLGNPPILFTQYLFQED